MDQMDQLNLMKLGQLAILDKKIEGLKIKIERARNELLLYLSIDTDIDKLKFAYILQAAQELSDTVTEYKKLLNQKEKINVDET
jgi:hypothetical protein